MIYLKLKKQPTTIAELMTALFSFSTVGILKSVATYIDKECTRLDCNEDKYRSVDDLVEIVQTYFPNSTEEEILKQLLELKIHRGRVCYRLNMINCYNIVKPTICFIESRTINTSDSRGVNLHNSKYKNWATVYRKAGFKSRAQVEKL